MAVYYILIFIWLSIYLLARELKSKNRNFNWKLFSAISMGIFLFLVMGLRHPTVGIDTLRYLYRYNNVVYPLDLSIFTKTEFLFHGFASILKNMGVSDQGYLIIYALIISAFFTRFFYKYSTNIFLSFYLYLTIGLFTMSLSGMRQMVAICIILLAFEFLMKNKFIPFVLCVLTAYNVHYSAICFLPAYFLRNLKITQKSGIVFLLITVSTIALRSHIAFIMKYLTPEEYMKYGILSDANPVNPLLIFISFAIPTACLFFWKYKRWSLEGVDRTMSILFIMSLLNGFTNILSLNSNMIGRLSYYFVPFNMVLMPIIISGIKDRLTKTLAVFCCIVFPIIQFILSTPDGTLSIDNYIFFWQ